MILEVIILLFTVGFMIYFNNYMPFFIQDIIDYLRLAVIKKSLCVWLYIKKRADSSMSDYIWDSRSKQSLYGRMFLDWAWNVDSNSADQNVASGTDSIYIWGAYATYKGKTYDVEYMLDSMWDYGDGIQIKFLLQNLLGQEQIIIESNEAISVNIKYSGHSNVTKRLEAGTFYVKYSGMGLDYVNFPPYPSTDCVKKGLGVTRVISAQLSDKSYCTEEARRSAGLKGSFYRDLSNSNVHKNTVLCRNLKEFNLPKDVVVSTSKGTVLCNKNDVSEDEPVVVTMPSEKCDGVPPNPISDMFDRIFKDNSSKIGSDKITRDDSRNLLEMLSNDETFTGDINKVLTPEM